ncbi:hypothetical protein QL285_086584 [Trifolium repens]|nr:hypothetical protein QL285_086584 [Trifolium repens]
MVAPVATNHQHPLSRTIPHEKRNQKATEKEEQRRRNSDATITRPTASPHHQHLNRETHHHTQPPRSTTTTKVGTEDPTQRRSCLPPPPQRIQHQHERNLDVQGQRRASSTPKSPTQRRPDLSKTAEEETRSKSGEVARSRDARRTTGFSSLH